MEQEHTKPTSNWQEFWQILRHGQFGKLFAGATENTLIQFFRYCFVGGAATVVDWGISALLFFAVFDQHYAILANGCSFVAGLLANYFPSPFWVFRASKVPSGGISRIRRNRRGGTSADDRHYKGQRDNTWKYHQCLSDDRKSSFYYGGIPVEFLRTEVSLVFEKRSLTG